MPEQKFCKNCNQKHNCDEIYRKLGDVKGRSVAVKVVVAFLLPLVVFIASLAVFEEILAEATNIKALQTALSFLLALSVTFVCILIIKVIGRELRKDK